MAPSVGVTGFGTLLAIGDGVGGASVSYAPIAECRDITGPNLTTELVDFTHQQSPGNYRERKPTFLSAGQISVDLTFLPENATQGYAAGLIKDFNDRALRDFQLTFPNPDGTYAQFSAFVGSLQINAPIADRLSARLMLEISGEVVWANAT